MRNLPNKINTINTNQAKTATINFTFSNCMYHLQRIGFNHNRNKMGSFSQLRAQKKYQFEINTLRTQLSIKLKSYIVSKCITSLLKNLNSNGELIIKLYYIN